MSGADLIARIRGAIQGTAPYFEAIDALTAHVDQLERDRETAQKLNDQLNTERAAHAKAEERARFAERQVAENRALLEDARVKLARLHERHRGLSEKIRAVEELRTPIDELAVQVAGLLLGKETHDTPPILAKDAYDFAEALVAEGARRRQAATIVLKAPEET